MAYGGVPVYQFSQPGGVSFRNFIRIDGLTLDPWDGSPIDPAFPFCGELTTAVPGPNQLGLPPTFGRGRGRWRPGDERLVEETVELIFDPADISGFAVAAGVTTFPTILDGDLVCRRTNPISDPGPARPVRLYLRYNHTGIL